MFSGFLNRFCMDFGRRCGSKIMGFLASNWGLGSLGRSWDTLGVPKAAPSVPLGSSWAPIGPLWDALGLTLASFWL